MTDHDHGSAPLGAEDLELLQLDDLGDGRFTAPHHGDGEVRDVVFGGQMLAQMIVAATTATPGKRVKSLQSVFARAASFKAPLEIVVEPVHVGRVFASQNVSVRQGERNCVQAVALLDVEEADLIEHSPPMPDVPGPDDAAVASNYLVYPGAEVRIVDDVDLLHADAPVGPAELFLWTRLPGPALDLTTSQAVLAWATDGYLIATAMRPHAGVGQEQAHRSISTGVISEALSFHRPFDASRWLLIAMESPFAGGGRAYGRANVFSEDGTLVASFTQESIIRGMGDRAGSAGPSAM
jgi:acyl-CoA thioesterase